MKKKLFLAGILGMALVFGFVLVSCNTGGGSSDSNPEIYVGTAGGKMYTLEIEGDTYTLTIDGKTSTGTVKKDADGSLILTPKGVADKPITVTIANEGIGDIKGTITFDTGETEEPPATIVPTAPVSGKAEIYGTWTKGTAQWTFYQNNSWEAKDSAFDDGKWSIYGFSFEYKGNKVNIKMINTDRENREDDGQFNAVLSGDGKTLTLSNFPAESGLDTHNGKFTKTADSAHTPQPNAKLYGTWKNDDGKVQWTFKSNNSWEMHDGNADVGMSGPSFVYMRETVRVKVTKVGGETTDEEQKITAVLSESDSKLTLSGFPTDGGMGVYNTTYTKQ
jgi:hypothetical protein